MCMCISLRYDTLCISYLQNIAELLTVAKLVLMYIGNTQLDTNYVCARHN
jgi:hypothetical protein